MGKLYRVAIGAIAAVLIASAAKADGPDISAQRLLESWRGGDPGTRMVAEVNWLEMRPGHSMFGTAAPGTVVYPLASMKRVTGDLGESRATLNGNPNLQACANMGANARAWDSTAQPPQLRPPIVAAQPSASFQMSNPAGNTNIMLQPNDAAAGAFAFPTMPTDSIAVYQEFQPAANANLMSGAAVTSVNPTNPYGRSF